MSQSVSPLAGKPAPESILVDVPKLLAAYADLKPDPAEPSQRVAFGTSGPSRQSVRAQLQRGAHPRDQPGDLRLPEKPGHRRAAVHRRRHARRIGARVARTRSKCSLRTVCETMIAAGGEFTPTPAISHAILVHNRGRTTGLADGIVITPSHNPPDNGGFKYNPPNGGPADTDVTGWVQKRANALLEGGLEDVKRIPFERARRARARRTSTTTSTPMSPISASIIDFDAIRGAGIRMGVDPLGGAGVHYWAPIAERYKLDLTVVSETVDPQFAFMTVDWDGKHPHGPVVVLCDAAADRAQGSLRRRVRLRHRSRSPRHRHAQRRPDGAQSLSYRFDRLPVPASPAMERTRGDRQDAGQHRDDRSRRERLGRRLVRSSGRIQMVFAGTLRRFARLRRRRKRGRIACLRRDGSVWTTDKDGIVPALLSAEITARLRQGSGRALRGAHRANSARRYPIASKRAATADRKRSSPS